MHKAMQDYYKAMLRVLKYRLDFVNQGLVCVLGHQFVGVYVLSWKRARIN